VINGLQHVFEKWVERCKKCIACQGRYFEKETVTAPPQSSDSVKMWVPKLWKRPPYYRFKSIISNIFQNNIALALSGSGSAAALLHPNGRVYQHGSRVEILGHDAHGNNKW